MTSLHVTNLHPEVTESHLLQTFQYAGAIESVKVCRDWNTQQSLRYGYVNFQQPADALWALENYYYESIMGRPMIISWALNEPPRYWDQRIPMRKPNAKPAAPQVPREKPNAPRVRTTVENKAQHLPDCPPPPLRVRLTDESGRPVRALNRNNCKPAQTTDAKACAAAGKKNTGDDRKVHQSKEVVTLQKNRSQAPAKSSRVEVTKADPTSIKITVGGAEDSQRVVIIVQQGGSCQGISKECTDTKRITDKEESNMDQQDKAASGSSTLPAKNIGRKKKAKPEKKNAAEPEQDNAGEPKKKKKRSALRRFIESCRRIFRKTSPEV